MQVLLDGIFHGKISGDEGKDALGIPHWNEAGDHPNLTASSIKIGGRPDTCVGKRRRHHTTTFQGRSIQAGPAAVAHTNHFYAGEDHLVHDAFRYSITRMNP